MVTHELRNPLNALAGWLHLIGAEPAMKSGIGERAVSGARRAIEQQLAQIDMLGKLLRLSGGAAPPPDACLDLAELVASEAKAGMLEAERDGPTGRLSIEGAGGAGGSGPVVRGDSELLGPAVRSLVAFAARHGAAGAPVELTLSALPHGAELVLRVDEGDDAGLSIWHAFGQSGSRLSLDLYLAMLAVESCGGTVRPRRATAGGEELEIRLPVASPGRAVPAA
jgi:signal transduction histidine kinase